IRASIILRPLDGSIPPLLRTRNRTTLAITGETVGTCAVRVTGRQIGLWERIFLSGHLWQRLPLYSFAGRVSICLTGPTWHSPAIRQMPRTPARSLVYRVSCAACSLALDWRGETPD